MARSPEEYCVPWVREERHCFHLSQKWVFSGTAFPQDARILSTPLAHNDTHLHVVVLTFSQPKHSGATLAGTVSVVSIQKHQPQHSAVLHFQEFSAPWVTPDWDSSNCMLLANPELTLVCLSSHMSNASGVLHLLNLSPSAGDNGWTNIELHQAMFAHLVSLNGSGYLFTASHNAEQPFKNFNLTVYDANTGKLCAELPRRQWTIAKHHGEVESVAEHQVPCKPTSELKLTTFLEAHTDLLTVVIPPQLTTFYG
ncbi:hypothetical protein CLF_107494 [Clonorchis sinensis]|uniref:Uncharacterized protein n=1 Tax=Clonorchis sinensis TaxID=79923 RepID=G7YGW2_CLOSI|nr:hypothetical protein CLF_107494 [Clonorchis sinensis]